MTPSQRLANVVFTIWMGPFEMSPQRSEALLSISRTIGCPHVHITQKTLHRWIDPSFPLHPLFFNLSSTHQADYLRCYLLHLYGGGYTDIKHTSKEWSPFFDALHQSPAFGIGYTEVGPNGVAPIGGSLEQEMKSNFRQILGVCSMIFRPGTHFTAEWYKQLHAVLNDKASLLAQHPARHPQDRAGASFTDGSVSNYPFSWTELLGNIFHPLAYAHKEHLLHADMAPSFQNYR